MDRRRKAALGVGIATALVAGGALVARARATTGGRPGGPNLTVTPASSQPPLTQLVFDLTKGTPGGSANFYVDGQVVATVTLDASGSGMYQAENGAVAGSHSAYWKDLATGEDSNTVTMTVLGSTPGGAAVTITAKIISQGYPEVRGYPGGSSVADPTGYIPLVVQFSATVAGGVSPYSFAWTFGDGATGTGATVSHTYSTVGTFAPSVTVTDAIGDKASATASVTAQQQLGTTLTLIFGLNYYQTGAQMTMAAHLSDSAGPIVGETVSFYQGTTLLGTATTDSYGTAYLTITAPSAPGTVTATAQFAGDAAKGLLAATSTAASATVYAPLSVSVSAT